MAATPAAPPSTFLHFAPKQRTRVRHHAFYPSFHPRPSIVSLGLNNSPHVTVATDTSQLRRSRVVASALSGSASRITESTHATELAGGEETADLLDEVRVFDLKGNAIPISDLWKDRKAVVAFARHFGCVLCRKRADYLASKKDVMDASGVALVLIGPGSIEQAKTFYEQTNFKGEVYADPNHSSYEALRFVSGVATTFTPGAGLKIIQLYMEGYRQNWKLSFERDTVSRGGWQQGGIIVAGPGKRNISYIHKDKEAGDDPDIQEIIQACCS